jgi:transcriptional regulator GlxA family with amidase domain
MSDCIDFKESTIPMAPRWSRRGDGLDEPRAVPEPVSDRAAELARTLRIAWLEKNLDAYVPLLRDLAPEFGYSSRALARALRITPRHLQRIFAATLRQTPQCWLNEQRLLAARQMLQTACTVKEVAYSLGFHSASQLSRDFKSHFGVAPSTFLVSQYARSCPSSLQDVRPAPSLAALPQRGRGDSD